MLLAAALAAPALHAETVSLPPVSVTARVQSVPAFDLPASIDVIDAGAASARPQASLSESLGGVPGVLARDRQNFAQDTQLSIRGFGARSTFGVRGVRLYADGIPATMPDGQGQLSHFALAAGDRLEVMRGPFSALYGNSSGGVVQLWSADGTAAPQVDLRATAARYGTATASARLLGSAAGTGYHLAAALFDTDGYREHGAARRESLNLKLHRALPGDGRLRGAAPALFGSAVGDHTAPGIAGLALREIPGRDRTTPAGRFVGGYGPSLDAGRVLWVDYDSAVSIHPTATGVPAEQRAERLESPTPDDNRITHGCINVSPGFYEQVIRPTFERGGVFYILPDAAPLAETFPEFVQSRATSRRSGGRRARPARQ